MMVNGSRAKIRRGQAVKAIYRRSKILTPVAALDTAPMGVTPPCPANEDVSQNEYPSLPLIIVLNKYKETLKLNDEVGMG
ncbi:MAG: hypothetical protein MJE68_03710, partial [Proteobacteria bacterium]|nr:hypothetical protein [Pseudomonadota bacterium]